MARAKRTDRAEARRRHRATLAELENEVGLDDAESSDSADGAPVRRGPATAQSAPTLRPGQRMGIGQAFGLAAQRANIRMDLAALPWLTRSTKAIWLPSVVVVAAGILYLVAPGQAAVAFLATTLLAPPSLIPPFAAGLLAPRGSWLAGTIVGFVSGLMAVGITLAQASAGLVAPERVTPDVLAFFLLASPIFGLGVGAFAGFYRRFLRYTAPPPGARRKTTSRPATRGR